MCVCASVHMLMCVYLCAPAFERAFVRARECARVSALVCVCIRLRPHFACMRVHVHALVRLYLCMCVCTRVNVFVRSCVSVFVCAHICVHARVHFRA